MSTTETTTTNQSQSSSPELTFVNRVASIPMIHASWETLDGALSSNIFTRSPYALGKGLSSTAVRLTEPIQKRFAPLIMQADQLANQSLDMVQSRYPYPFQVRPEDVANLVKERRQSASNFANKAIDEKVKSPAMNVAQGIDQKFAPIVDYFEVAVNRIYPNEGAGPSSPPDAQYQYQRALALSGELLRQAQAHSILLQRTTEIAQSILQLTSSSVNSASVQFHSLSSNMAAELERLQLSAASFSTGLQNTLQQSVPSYPQIRESYAEFSNQLSAAAQQVGTIVSDKNLPVQDKVNRMADEIRNRVTPLLDRMRGRLAEFFAGGREQAPASQSSAEPVTQSVVQAAEQEQYPIDSFETPQN